MNENISETFSIKNKMISSGEIRRKLVDNSSSTKEGFDRRNNTTHNEKIKKNKITFKIILKTLIVQLIFVSAVILYSSVGAFVFQTLEQYEEIRLCEGKSLKIIYVNFIRSNFLKIKKVKPNLKKN